MASRMASIRSATEDAFPSSARRSSRQATMAGIKSPIDAAGRFRMPPAREEIVPVSRSATTCRSRTSSAAPPRAAGSERFSAACRHCMRTIALATSSACVLLPTKVNKSSEQAARPEETRSQSTVGSETSKEYWASTLSARRSVSVSKAMPRRPASRKPLCREMR